MLKANRVFRTRDQVEQYFGAEKIRCLLCGKHFMRLSMHLAAKHSITTDQYKGRFGLPWTRGLTSAQSHANSGWDEKRRQKASKLASKSEFFRFAKSSRRRPAPFFVQTETAKHLGNRAVGYDKRFDATVRALFKLGLPDAAIARALNVNRMTVNRRTRQWRTSKNKGHDSSAIRRASRKIVKSSTHRAIP